MSRKQDRAKHPTQVVAAASGQSPAETEIQRIRELIAGRHSKAALGLAKDLHKRAATAETETLLLDAYQCRIEDMLRLGMAVEAKVLLEMVGQRFPSSRSRMMDLHREIAVVDGRLEEIVAPLADGNLSPEVRDRIETFVRQRVYDLTALASVSSLPREHSLRQGASVLAAAFQTVTTGPVDDGVVALSQVSRRSALAPWKALIRAIASFYRREDDDCKKWLRLVPEDSAPARLIRPLMAMLGTGATSEFSAAEQRLVSTVGAVSGSLRPALAVLEKTLTAKKHKPLLEAARTAVTVCGQCYPEIRERLRQHIVIRSLAHGVSRAEICSAIGAPRENAYFSRLLACSVERHRDADSSAEALFHWEYFRRAALQEKRFVAGSLEDGVLSLHMAKIAERLPSDDLDDLDDFEYTPLLRRDRSSGGLGDEDLRSPEMLYERACRADPHPEAFHAWLQWADRHRSWRDADRVAELWRQALPRDTRPALYLMESAEKRGAYQKSLQHLERAEELDRLNPEVRRAKLRLLLSAAIRHLRQGKTRLVVAENEHIEALPEVRAGEIASLATVLRLLCAVLENDRIAMPEQNQRLQTMLGSAVAAFVLTNGLAQTANMGDKVELPSLELSRFSALELLTGTARSLALGDWAGLALPLPLGWERDLLAALDQPDCPTDVTQILVLGESAFRSGAMKLAYALSAVGLAQGGADARFLFLRGRVLPPGQDQRREGCFLAALELARRDRNLDLAGKILDRVRGNDGFYWGADFLGDPATINGPVAPDLLSEILKEEREENEFPVPGRRRPPKYVAKLGPKDCDCPSCRAERGETTSDGGEEDDGDDWNPTDFAGEPVVTFSEALDQFEQILDMLSPRTSRKEKKAIGPGAPPEIVAPGLFGSRPGGKSKKPMKNLPPPEQGELF
jgi:tetratricopeptide (TPR) repeat protein